MKTWWLTTLALLMFSNPSTALQLPFPPKFSSDVDCSHWLQEQVLIPVKKLWFKKLTSSQVRYSADEIKHLSQFSHWFESAINNSQENYNNGNLTSIEGICYLFSHTRNKEDITLGQKILDQEIAAFNNDSTSLPIDIPLHCDGNKHCSVSAPPQPLPFALSSSLLPFGT